MNNKGRGHPTCAWTGTDPSEERAITCGRVAQFCVEYPSGHRAYACAEHLEEIRAEAPEGSTVLRALHLDDEGKPRADPDSAISWG